MIKNSRTLWITLLILLGVAIFLWSSAWSGGGPSDDEVLVTVREMVRNQAPEVVSIDQSRPLRISRKIDLTGDGAAEYIVDLGTGGAATDMYAIVRLENGKPVLPGFKDPNGEVYWQALLSGSGGAGRYSYAFELDPENRAVYLKYFSVYGEENDYCVGAAYVWNELSGQFEHDGDLSAKPQNEITAECGQVRNSLSIDSE